MNRIETVEQLLQYVDQGISNYFVVKDTNKSFKSIDFSKTDKSQICLVHKEEDYEEFIDVTDWEESTLFSYITEGTLYKY